MQCANINHPDYIALADLVGDTMAHTLWNDLNGDVGSLISSKKSIIKSRVQKVIGQEGSLVINNEQLSDLNQRLIEVLAPFGVNVTAVDSMREATGVNSIGAADIINKTILILKGRLGQQALPEEASHFIIELLGNQHPLVKRMMDLVPASQMYSQVVADYGETYEMNEEKLKKEAAGKLLADALKRGKLEQDIPRFYRTLTLLWEKLKSMFSKAPDNLITKEIEDVFNLAAEKILTNDLSGMSTDNLVSPETYYQLDKISVEDRRDVTIEGLYDKAIKSLSKKIEILERSFSSKGGSQARLSMLADINALKTKMLEMRDDPIQALSTYVDRAHIDLMRAKEEMRNLLGDEHATAEDLRRLKGYTVAYKEMAEIKRILSEELDEDFLDTKEGQDLMKKALEANDALSTFNGTYKEIGLTIMDNFLRGYSSRTNLADGHEFKLNPGDIADLLSEADMDVSFLARWTGVMADSKDPVLALATKVIHTKKQEIRMESIDFTDKDGGLYDMLEELENFQKSRGVSLENKQKLFEFMLEKDNKGRLTGNIVDINTDAGQAIKAMPETDPRKKFYKFFTESYYAAQERMPHGTLPKFNTLPSIIARNKERLYRGEGAVSMTKEGLREAVSFRADEKDYETAGETMFVPAKYHAPIGKGEGNIDPADLSYDLGMVLEHYNTMSINNKKMREILHEMELLKDLVKERDVVKTRVNKDGEAIVQKKSIGANTRAYEQLVDYLDAHLYGARNKKEVWTVGGKDFNASKAADTLNKYTSLRSLALNVFSGISNVTMGKAMNFMEANGGQYYSRTDYINATANYTTSLPEILADVNRRKPKSKIGLLNRKFDTLQEFDEYGNHIKGSTLGNRMTTSGSLFFTQTAGEHMLQSTLMEAMMRGQKITLEDGSEMSLWDAYQEVNGKLVLNEKAAKVFTQKDEIEFSEKVQAVSQKLHGVYNNLDANALQRLALGRMVMMFRKWLAPGARARYRTKWYNERLGTVEEGTYMTMLRFATNFQGDLRNMKIKLLSTKWEDLEGWEKANIRKAITEISYMIGSSLLIMALGALAGDDDDDKDWFTTMGLYQIHRFNSEVMFYVSITDAGKILKSPAASITALEGIGAFGYRLGADTLAMLAGGEPAKYKRDKGLYKKGDWKLEKKFEDMLPIYKEIRALQVPQNRLSWLEWK